MVIQPTPKQREAYKLLDTNDIILFGGAIRGGKTYWGLLTIFSLCFKYPNSRWLVLRESVPTIQKTLLKTFNELLDNGFRQYVTNWNGSTLTLTFYNQSQVIIMSESYDQDKELNRFRGLEINGAFIDEINEIQEMTFNKVIERSGAWFHSDAPSKIIASCNPTHNWVKERFYDKWVNNTLPIGTTYVPSKITDNPNVPKEYLESLRKNLDPFEYEVFVEGNWELQRDTLNAFAWAFDPINHISDIPQYDKNKQLLISIDFNISPFACIFAHMWRDSEGEHLHIFDEYTIENGNIPALIDKLKVQFNSSLSSCVITGDYNGNARNMANRDNASHYELIKRGLNLNNSNFVLPSNPPHQKSRNDCNFILQNFNDLQINQKKCVNLIRDIRTVQVDAFGAIIKRNRTDKSQRADHLDCFRYLCNTHLEKWVNSKQKYRL
jgi:hypothetical protein